MKKIVFGTIAFMILLGISAYAQNIDAQIELLRSDIKAERIALITEVMEFTDAESEAFWPIYREYENEFRKLGDQRLALIKDYAEHFEKMTDKKAEDLFKRSVKIKESRLKLQKTYFNKFAKALSPITAVKFFQLDNQINMLLDLQISSELPLIQRGIVEEVLEKK